MASHTGGLPPFPTTSWFVSKLRPAAIEAARADLISLWGGQIAPNLRHRTAASLMQSLLFEQDVAPTQQPHHEEVPA